MVTLEITIKDIMKLNSLSTAKVVAGSHKINNIVKGVTIIEAPDIVNFLSGGELLLTSLYSTSKETFSYREFIQTMAERGVAALAIKTQRFVANIPQEIITSAEDFGLPIIELDPNTRFIDVMYPVMAELFNSQVNKLKYYKDVQEKFTALALKGEGLEAIINTLEQLIGYPVGVFDNNFKCVISTGLSEVGLTVEDLNNREHLNETFSYYRQKLILSDSDKEVSRIIVPIQALSLKAYLTIIELDRQLQELDFITLENAATVVCLEMVKQFAVQQVEQRFKNDLIRDIISGHIEPRVAMERAELLGWDLTKSYVAIVFHINNVDTYLKESIRGKRNLAIQGAKNDISMLISNVIKFHSRNHILGSKGDSIIIFWPTKNLDESFESLVKRLGNDIQAQVKKRFGNIKISIGIGTIASKVDELPRSYREANDAILFGQMIHGQDVIISYSELGIFRLLCGITDKRTLLGFVPESLRKLQQYDFENESDLIKTLEVFFDCNGNASKAAKELFVHYKTILYRLERIKELTNLDLEKTNNRLELEIGLKILKLVNQ